MTAQSKTRRPLRVRFRKPIAPRGKIVVLAGVLAVLWGLTAASTANAGPSIRIAFTGGKLRIGASFGSGPRGGHRGPQRPAPRINQFSLSSHRIPLGGAFTLSWHTQNATRVTIVTGQGSFNVAGHGSITLAAQRTGTQRIRLIAANRFGSTQRDLVLTVFPRRRGVRILSFSSDRPIVRAGGLARLTWHVQGAQRVQLIGPRGRVIDVPATGMWTARLPVRGTFTYRLLAHGRFRQVQSLLTVTAW